MRADWQGYAAECLTPMPLDPLMPTLPFFCPPTLCLSVSAPTHPNPPWLGGAQKYGRVLVVLPYVSIVNEKREHLEAVLRPMHASVKGFSGGAEDGANAQPLAPRCVYGWGQASLQRLLKLGPSPAALLTAYFSGCPLSRCSGETVAICTIEKANVAINRLAQEGRLGELCCVVVGALLRAAAPVLGGDWPASLLWPVPSKPAPAGHALDAPWSA